MFNSNHVFRTILLIIVIALTFFGSTIAQPLAANKKKFVGNIISNGNNIRSNFSKYWNQVTAENAGKWESVEGSPGSYNWTQLDNIYNYAVENGFPYKHHCLIWGNQQPNFMTTLDSTQQYQEIENWIKETGQRYPDAAMCDVVNEPLPNHAPPSYKNALGGDGTTGWDWIIKAFELAREYWSPNTKLILNDYNILSSSTNTNAIIVIVNLLKDRNLIDGIGCQAHGLENTSTATIKSNLDLLEATGVPVYISEFDVNIQDDSQQLAKYQSLFPIMYEHQAVKGITLWGYVQYDIWRTNAYLLTDRYVERPALEWLRSYLISPFRPVLISPVSTTDESLNPTLIWHASDSAAAYNVQISKIRSFSTLEVDTTVSDTVLQLHNLDENTAYYWRVNASNDKGTSEYTEFTIFVTKQITDVNKSERLTEEYVLDQNYPNPFNPTTKITYSIPKSSYVSLKVYNLLGQEVADLFDGFQNQGKYTFEFNGAGLSSGIYFYRLTADDFSATRKLILQK